MQFLERAWRDIRRGENIDLYLSVVVAFAVTILNFLGAATGTLTQSIMLAILGLMAFSALGSRHLIEGIKKEQALSVNLDFRT